MGRGFMCDRRVAVPAQPLRQRLVQLSAVAALGSPGSMKAHTLSGTILVF